MGAMTKASRPPPLSPDEADANVSRHHAGRATNRTQDGSKPGKARSSGKPVPGRHGDRWAAYNAFVDVIAPRLTLAERAVWHVMFRHARDWTVSTSARRLSVAAGIDKGTASRALLRLQKAGLIGCTWKSTDKSEASRYSMHPRPGDCVASLVASSKP